MTKDRTPKTVPARNEPTPDALHRDMRKLAREAKSNPEVARELLGRTDIYTRTGRLSRKYGG